MFVQLSHVSKFEHVELDQSYSICLVSSFHQLSLKEITFIKEIEEDTEENTLEDSDSGEEEEEEGVKYQPTVLKSLPADLVRV